MDILERKQKQYERIDKLIGEFRESMKGEFDDVMESRLYSSIIGFVTEDGYNIIRASGSSDHMLMMMSALMTQLELDPQQAAIRIMQLRQSHHITSHIASTKRYKP